MNSVNQSPARPASQTRKRTGREAGKARLPVLVLVAALLTMVVGALWYFGSRNGDPEAAETKVRLSDSTKRALSALRAPVEIRFYSVLGTTGSSDSLRAFSDRVGQLLSAYKREAGGTIVVRNYHSRSDEDLETAASDGMRVFNLDKGEPSYLGLSVAQDDQQESLPRITPEWEQALEADLTRAILRVSGARSSAERTAATTQAAKDVDEEVKRFLPNLDSVPVEKGRQILRDRAFKDLKETATEMRGQIEEARQRLSEAQSAGSAEKQRAAMEQVQQAQAAQSERIKEISARLESQIAALERLKGASPTPR